MKSQESIQPVTRLKTPADPGSAAFDLADCVGRAQAGEINAFRELMLQHQKPIYFTLMRMLRDHDDASDITQRAFLKAYEELAKLREPAAFKGWLFRIATNLARNHMRSRGRHPHEPLEEAHAIAVDPTAESNIHRRQQIERLNVALEVLSPKQREVLLLRLEGDLDYKDIAEAVGSTEGSVRVHYHQAIKRLKLALSES